jgi:hypothetical protein
LLKVLVLVLLPEFETPDVDFEFPPVADAPEVEPDVAPDDDVLVLDAVVGVVGVVGGVAGGKVWH